jgi:hypothetical protein
MSVEFMHLVGDPRGRVANASRGAQLPTQAGGGGGAVDDMRVEDLERDLLAAHAILGEQHDRTPAAAKLAEDLEPVAEHVSGLWCGQRCLPSPSGTALTRRPPAAQQDTWRGLEACLRLRILMVAAVIGGGAACGFLSSETPHHTEQVAITAPWSELGLPLGGGTVTFSDRETVSVHHPKGDSATLSASYGAALQAAGWKLEHDGSAAGIVSQTWTRAEDSLSFTVQAQGEVLVASLAILAF